MTVAFLLRIDPLASGAVSVPTEAGQPEFDEAQALRTFGLAARRDPKDPDFDYILGQALLGAGRVREAAERLSAAVRLDRSQPDYHFVLGCALWRLGRIDEAEREFRDTVALRPADPPSLNAHAAALVRLKREREAQPILEDALRRDSDLADAHGNLGAALWGLGRTADGLQAIRRAVRLQPEESEHRRNLALALTALGKKDEATVVLKKAAAKWKTNLDLLFDLGEALHDTGRDDEALKAFDEAVRLDPTALTDRPHSRELRDALRLKSTMADTLPPRHGQGLASIVFDRVLDAIHGIPGAFRLRGGAPGLVFIVVVAALAWVGWAVGPHYVSYYLLRDDLKVVARSQVQLDTQVRDRLAHAIRDRGLSARVDADHCEIATRTDWRRIVCDYSVRTQVLPGLSRTLSFHIDVEQPYLYDPDAKTY